MCKLLSWFTFNSNLDIFIKWCDAIQVKGLSPASCDAIVSSRWLGLSIQRWSSGHDLQHFHFSPRSCRELHIWIERWDISFQAPTSQQPHHMKHKPYPLTLWMWDTSTTLRLKASGPPQRSIHTTQRKNHVLATWYFIIKHSMHIIKVLSISLATLHAYLIQMI